MQRDDLREPASCELREEVVQRVRAMQLVGAEGPEQEDPPTLQLSGEIWEELERGLVGPVQVLDRDHDQFRLGRIGEHAREAFVCAIALELGDGLRARTALEVRWERQLSCSEGIDERAEGTPGLDLAAFPDQDERVVGTSAIGERAQERALPQAGFAANECGGALATRRPLKVLGQAVELGRAPHDLWAEHASIGRRYR